MYIDTALISNTVHAIFVDKYIICYSHECYNSIDVFNSKFICTVGQ